MGWRICGALVALLVLGLYLVGLDAPLSNYDEPVYAEFVRSTLDGELGLSYRGIFTWQRPPTTIWLYATFSAIVPGELGLRLGPTLFTVASLLGAGAVVWRRFASPPAAVLTALLCAAIPSEALYGRMLLSDPPFVLLCVAAAASAMAAHENPRWLLWAAAALGATFALKSMAGAVPTLALGPWIAVAVRRHFRDPRLRPWWSLLVFGALAGSFYAIGLLVDGQRFYDEHIRFILLDRAEGELGAIGIGGSDAYLLHLWRADGPVISCILGAGVACAVILAWRRRDLALATAAGSALSTLLLLSVLGTRLAHYLLPFYPLAAIATGGAVAYGLSHLARSSSMALRRWGGPATVALALALLFLGLSRPSFDAGAEPSYAARDLGLAARAEPDGPIFAYEWYAPALTYYADRGWHFATHSARAARSVHTSREFAEADVAQLVPPWPAEPFLLAGPSQVLRSDPDLVILDEIAQSEDFVLVRARRR